MGGYNEMDLERTGKNL